MSSITERILDVPAEHESNVFGQFDSHIKKIEKTLKVSVVARDGAVKILGPAANTRQAARVFEQLLELSRRGNVRRSAFPPPRAGDRPGYISGTGQRSAGPFGRPRTPSRHRHICSPARDAR